MPEKQVVPPTRIITRVVPTLNQKQYAAQEEKYIVLAKAKGPRAAITALKSEMEKDQQIARYCHEYMHSIGKEAYLLTKDFTQAIMSKDDICTSGYIHGVLQVYFQRAGDMYIAMQTVCNAYRKDSFVAWECHHGVGHGLMYFTGNDLPKAVQGCESYTYMSDRLACLNGAYMENFSADQKTHPTKYRKQDDFSYPCGSQKQAYKQDCYHNAVIYYLSEHRDNYSQALRWCDRLEKGFSEICYQSVGNQVTRRFIMDIPYTESQCSTASSSNAQSWCIVGIVNYYISHFGAIAPAEKLCLEMTPANRPTCENTVLGMRPMF